MSAAGATAPEGRVVNAMSVDVEDYFQVSAFDRTIAREAWPTMASRVVANTERLLDLFDSFAVRGTFFILGCVAERHPELPRTIAARGHEIGSHGHAHRLIYEQTKEEFREDVRRSKHLLEDLAGTAVRGYRAPSFSVTEQSLWALDVLIDEGFTYDASIFPIRHDRYGIRDAPRHCYVIRRADGRTLMEVPASTTVIGTINLPVAGGGYFRILPYRWTRWGINRVNQREKRPAIFYVHPWEIDPLQPRLRGSRLTLFRHYRNLEKTEARLRRLLKDFHFAPIRDVVPGLARDERPNLSASVC